MEKKNKVATYEQPSFDNTRKNVNPQEELTAEEVAEAPPEFIDHSIDNNDERFNEEV